MDKTLNKESICACGKTKQIIWVEPLRFQMGLEPSCYGYSTCVSCDVVQAHYSGSLDGAIDFQKFMASQGVTKAANEDKF